MKIGFYGDSFCCEIKNHHSIIHGYHTYIAQVKKHFKADIVHLGVGGSSVWDVIINQFDVNNIPDVCIFAWTDHARLYNKKVRNITLGSIQNKKLKDITFSELFNKSTIVAAKHYYDYLFDPIKSELEYKSALCYFDSEILSKIRKKTKIIHMWSFEKNHEWKTGIEIKTPLITFAANGSEANHIGGKDNNQKVFDMLMPIISS